MRFDRCYHFLKVVGSVGHLDLVAAFASASEFVRPVNVKG